MAHYRSAAAAGDAGAALALGWRYFKGEGTERNLLDARRCFAVAATASPAGLASESISPLAASASSHASALAAKHVAEAKQALAAIDVLLQM